MAWRPIIKIRLLIIGFDGELNTSFSFNTNTLGPSLKKPISFFNCPFQAFACVSLKIALALASVCADAEAEKNRGKLVLGFCESCSRAGIFYFLDF